MSQVDPQNKLNIFQIQRKRTKTFALPKSQSLSWWVCGLTCQKEKVKTISRQKRKPIQSVGLKYKIKLLIKIYDTRNRMNANQQVLRLYVSVAYSNTIMNVWKSSADLYRNESKKMKNIKTRHRKIFSRGPFILNIAVHTQMTQYKTWLSIHTKIKRAVRQKPDKNRVWRKSVASFGSSCCNVWSLYEQSQGHIQEQD